MWRKALEDLSAWMIQKDRKPLILRGARQVGKSTLVREFCRLKGLDLFEVNFEIQALRTLRSLQGLQVEHVIEEVELLVGKKWVPGRSLLFFDEIQANPVALQSLRYFFEKKPECAVIAAGSLLEFILGKEDLSMPVGRVEFYHLSPMTFSEFLVALGEESLSSVLQKGSPAQVAYSDTKTKRLLREYFVVGGMPEAVKSYCRKRDFTEVARVHRSLLQTYAGDFPKYGTRIKVDKIDSLFRSLPAFIGKKFKSSEIDPTAKSTSIAKVIDLFIKARIVLPCFLTKASGLPLESQKDEKSFRLYFLDVGLFHHAMKVSAMDLMNEEMLLLTKGVSAEQFVAQHLAFSEGPFEEPSLWYWGNQDSKGQAELDFLISHQSKTIPIEVKSGKAGKHKSLFVFMSRLANLDTFSQQPAIAVKLDLDERNSESWVEPIHSKNSFDQDQPLVFSLVRLPLYCIERLRDVL